MKSITAPEISVISSCICRDYVWKTCCREIWLMAYSETLYSDWGSQNGSPGMGRDDISSPDSPLRSL